MKSIQKRTRDNEDIHTHSQMEIKMQKNTRKENENRKKCCAMDIIY